MQNTPGKIQEDLSDWHPEHKEALLLSPTSGLDDTAKTHHDQLAIPDG